MILWFTGQPASGKTTLARVMRDSGPFQYIVDGDDLRELMPNPGYDERGRRQNIDRAQSIAAYLSSRGIWVAVALIAPYRDQREAFKARHPVLEVYLHAGNREARQEYRVENYEPPLDDFLDIDTGELTIAQAESVIYRAISAFPRRPRLVDPSEAG